MGGGGKIPSNFSSELRISHRWAVVGVDVCGGEGG